MSVTNGEKEKEIRLVNNWNIEQTYRVHDSSRIGCPWLHKRIGPQETHVVNIIGQKVRIDIVAYYSQPGPVQSVVHPFHN
jgi:hypothetical protein